MRIETEDYLDFSQVLLKPKRSKLTSRSEASVYRDFTFLHAPQRGDTLCPLMASNMTSVGTVEAARVLSEYNMLTALHKFYDKSYLQIVFSKYKQNSKIFYTMGSKHDELDKYCDVANEVGYYPNICIDVANGYSESFVDFVSRVRDLVKDKAVIIAGNVATPEITEELILRGADIVKVGIGSGAMCTTRSVTGVGVPQFTSIVECADAAHGVGGMVCSDGGITCPGDVVKAFGAGADIVMVGSQFAAHDENTEDGVGAAIVYGMSSSMAQDLHYSDKKSYRSSEGRVVAIEKRGPLENTIEYYLGGLRSGMTYIGADKIKEIPKRATFIKVSKILNESHAQDTVRIR